MDVPQDLDRGGELEHRRLGEENLLGLEENPRDVLDLERDVLPRLTLLDHARDHPIIEL
eukprot:COSAG03_NODE_1234_length_4497_cov_83.406810_6_plen_59_part_00